MKARCEASLLHDRPFQPKPRGVHRALDWSPHQSCRGHQNGFRGREPIRSSTRIRFPTLWWPSTSPMSTWQHSAVFAGRRKPYLRMSTVSGRTRAFITMPTMRSRRSFMLASSSWLDEGRKRRCVIMCSEAVWWRCHRRIVTDYLIACGEAVFHIMGQGRLGSARLRLRASPAGGFCL